MRAGAWISPYCISPIKEGCSPVLNPQPPHPSDAGSRRGVGGFGTVHACTPAIAAGSVPSSVLPRPRAMPGPAGFAASLQRSAAPRGAGADTSQISEHDAGGWRGLALAERQGEQLAAASLPLRAPAGVRSLTFPASVPLLCFSLSPLFFFFLSPNCKCAIKMDQIA